MRQDGLEAQLERPPLRRTTERLTDIDADANALVSAAQAGEPLPDRVELAGTLFCVSAAGPAAE